MAGLACKLVPRWIGWATAVWNLAWLAGLVLARPWDIYFPILHLVMPVFIGAALILRRGREGAQEADLADMPDMLASSPTCSVEGLMDDLA